MSFAPRSASSSRSKRQRPAWAAVRFQACTPPPPLTQIARDGSADQAGTEESDGGFWVSAHVNSF